MKQYIAVPSLKITLPNFYHPEDNKGIKFKFRDELVEKNQHIASHAPDGIFYLRETIITYRGGSTWGCWYRFERDNFVWWDSGKSVLLPKESLIETKGKEIIIPKLQNEYILETKAVRGFRCIGQELNILFSRKPLIPIRIGFRSFPKEITFNTKGDIILRPGEKLIDVK